VIRIDGIPLRRTLGIPLLERQFHLPLVLQFLIQRRARVAARHGVHHAAQCVKIVYLRQWRGK